MSRLRQRGFTLVELLTVIAIIAILAAMFMPVIQSARLAAFKTLSGKNLSQITTAAILYSNDCDQYMPPVYTHGAPVNGGTQEIIGTDQVIMSYVQSERLWGSPVDSTYRATADPSFYNDGDFMKRAIKRSYQFIGNVITKRANGYDVDTGMGVGFPTGYWDMPGRAISSYEIPAQTIFMVEGWRGDYEYSTVGSIYYNAVWSCLTWMFPGRPKENDSGWKAMIHPSCHQEYEESRSNPGYFGGKGLYTFADSHMATLTWQRVAKDDFELLRAVGRLR